MQPHRARVKNAIDIVLNKNKNYSVDDLTKLLQKEGIYTAVRRNDQGILFGLTYGDNKTKCVFNGSALGKQYSAKGIQERWSEHGPFKQDERHENEQPINPQFGENNSLNKDKTSIEDLLAAANMSKAAEEFLLPNIQGGGYVPHQFKKKKKKKRKTVLNN